MKQLRRWVVSSYMGKDLTVRGFNKNLDSFENSSPEAKRGKPVKKTLMPLFWKRRSMKPPISSPKIRGRRGMKLLLLRLLTENEGQDIAEYAVMLAVILVIVVGTVRLIGSNANNVFSNVASTLQ